MGAGGEEKAVFVGLKNDAEKSLPKAAEHIGEFHGGTAEELGQQVEKHITNDSDLKGTFESIDKVPPQAGSTSIMSRTTKAGVAKDHPYYQFSDEELEAAGITSKGADDVETGGTDPVDVVSGQLIATATDVVRMGVLPLVIRRAYTSGYGHGGLFGHGWASTLDIRLLVDADGIRFLGESAQVLDYGTPAGLGLGLPAFPAHGARWPLTREHGRYRIQDPESGISWLFDAACDEPVRPVIAIRDRNGNQATIQRGEHGFPVRLEHSGGYSVHVRTHESPVGARVAGLALDPGDGQLIDLVTYAYDDAGRLVAITDSSGVPYLYEWDEDDRICGWVDRNGHDYHYAYDPSGRVVHTFGAGGYLSSTITYDRAARITTVTDGEGHTAAYHYDRFQQVVKIVDPLGGEQVIERDRYGRILSVTDPLGNTARTERDASGLPLRYITPTGAETTLEYNGLGLPVRISEPNGAVWAFAYDERGNLTCRTDPLGATTSYTYDARGGLLTVTDPRGAVTRFDLDAAGLQTGVTDPLGGRWLMQRDPFGRVSATTDPTGRTRRATYGIEGQLLRSEDPAGAAICYRYDPAGNLIERLDEAGARTRFEYGPMGVRTGSIDALGNRHSFAHDSELRLTCVTGPTGLVWRFTYDAAGRLVAERDFDGREITYRVDGAGRRVERISPTGQISTFTYDADGHLVHRVDGGIEHRFSYDAAGLMVRAEGPECVLEITRDLCGRPITETVDGRVLTRHYDPAGNLLRRTTPSGADSQWSFDAAGNPAALSNPYGEVAFGYDPAGRETMRRFGPQVTFGRRYDPSGRMSGVRIMAGERLLQGHTYGYRADGAIERVSDFLNGAADYELDLLGRATQVRAGNQHSEAYAYDELGTVAVAGAGDGEPWTVVGTRIQQDARFTYTYDAEGRLIRKHGRTLSGKNISSAYAWNALGQLTRAETPEGVWSYTYDPLGRRTGKTAMDHDGTVRARTAFTYDGPRLVEETREDLRGGQTVATTWEYEPNSFVPVTQLRRYRITGRLPDDYVDEQFHAIVADLVGTPAELVACDGAITRLAPRTLWGQPASPATADDPCPLAFPGQYRDAETGLHYNLHRYYDPDTASYLSADPLGLLPGPNPRAYIGNPLTESDPLGLNGEGGKPVPPPNLSGSRRVPYGEDPMSNLAITARNAQGWLRGGKNVAVYLYKDENGSLGAVGIRSDGVHSERLGWDAVSNELGIGKEQVDSIYTELQPCGPDYHDCDKWLADNFPGKPVTHSFDYGPDTAGRTAGMNALQRALTQVRKGNLPK